MLGRIISVVVLVASAYLLPWWFVVVLTCAALFYFRNFYEAVGIGFLLDALYGTGSVFGGWPYMLTLIAVVLLVLATKLRERMIMY